MLRRLISFLRNGHRFEDGLLSTHIAAFLDDPRFLAAYRAGQATGSWHGAELRWRAYICCWAAEHALTVGGDFVECGVNRGGLSRTVIEYVDFGVLPREFFLLDTFSGDPEVASINKQDYEGCYQNATKTFAAFPNVHLVPGRIPETLSLVTTSLVAYLSIDLNNAAPEVASLRYFWPKLFPGAVVVLDDYAHSPEYVLQKRAIDDLGRELGFTVMTLPTGQGLIVKTEPNRAS